MPAPKIDRDYLQQRLSEMLAIPSPTGFTDGVVRYVCGELDRLGLVYELARRGTIVATLAGRERECARAVVTHLDTIGATVSNLGENGRLGLRPLGTWSSRFAEGGRVTVFSKRETFRGQVLPLLASGHAFDHKVDELPVGWPQVEVRLNRLVSSRNDLIELGLETGDFVAFDPDPEWDESGFVSARHLDDKAGAAALLATLEASVREGVTPAVDFAAIFTVTEEVGTGGARILDDHFAEFIGIDVAPVAPGQTSTETAVTLCAQDTSGPFDRKLLLQLAEACRQHAIPFHTDVFRYYYSDANSAIIAGNDVRHALIAFGTDATHGYERTHMRSLEGLARLLGVYSQLDLLDS
jgi:peptidase M42 family hydrolase